MPKPTVNLPECQVNRVTFIHNEMVDVIFLLSGLETQSKDIEQMLAVSKPGSKLIAVEEIYTGEVHLERGLVS